VTLPRLTGHQLRDRLEAGWRPWLVHVGPADEFARGHLPGAVWIAGVEQLLTLLDTADPIVLYGAGPNDELIEAWSETLLADPGPPIWHYRGGLAEWRNVGAPLEP
jgi:rhodanese-related sulfurtransferase